MSYHYLNTSLRQTSNEMARAALGIIARIRRQSRESERQWRAGSEIVSTREATTLTAMKRPVDRRARHKDTEKDRIVENAVRKI